VKSFAVTLDRLRRGVADAFGLFVVPATLAALPWPIAFRLLRALSRRSTSFGVEADAAWNAARAYVEPATEARWKSNYKLTRWIERVDTYLTLLRSRAWWARHVDVCGEWPAKTEPCLFLTYHWGAGHWIWKFLQAEGLAAYFLARRPQVGDLGASRVALWYGRLRGWGLARIGSLGPLYTVGSVERMRGVFADGLNVVGMLDLPASDRQDARKVALIGEVARLPAGLVELARQVRTSVAIFSCGFDPHTGRRNLAIERMEASTIDVDEVLARYARHLDTRLRQASECWMMWHEAHAIFVERVDTPADRP
jgi:hypothetical protein